MLRLLAVSVLAGCILGNPVQRIVGGSKTIIEKYSYQVRLTVKIGEKLHTCGGSIIGRKWILTAAHCTKDAVVDVYVGSSTLTDGVIYSIKETVIHPNYTVDERNAVYYDYALIELQQEIGYGSKAQPIALPMQDEEFDAGTPATVTGWGRVKENSTDSFDLQVVRVKIVGQQQCMKSYPSLTLQTICAGTRGFFKRGICSGDSGGLLVTGGKIIGVVSFSSEKCAIPGIPDVYANVANQRNWIKEVTGI